MVKLMSKVKTAINSKKGDGSSYISSGMKMVIAVVVGAVLLTGTIMIVSQIVMPKVTDKIDAAFTV